MPVEAGDSSPHVGQKRRADDDLRNEQRLAKRFDLLNLEQNGKLYVPIHAPLPTPPAASYSPSESMLVDDTPNRIFIHNLDEELREIEEEKDKLIFLPDIEKKLGKIPKSTLVNGVHPSAMGKQMVLYEVPESLTVPKENDSVRKAIIESRARASEETAKKAKEPTNVGVPKLAVNGARVQRQGANNLNRRNYDQITYREDDEDAMDIE
ncbi:uncharacterized protein KY384_008517 [Bacidia gigantensis]|uniref:uncharacterized protein n=1 Tax=Bacidia gigantensis TaxID=2732470 RepID=UPI001D0477AF|nr:uncharacterized protein KY384_008517 [Bacidia gigantensis]KAG8527088.1 hypothetical protein KY384_008517 [Bacidia gigantensis]